MKYFLFFIFSPICFLSADVSRFIGFNDFSSKPIRTKILTKSSAFISPQSTELESYQASNFVSSKSISLDREILEKRLAESIAHRYQCSGKIVSFVTREWNPVDVSSSFLIKITDCSPDELGSSMFVRFSIWDEGNLIGDFAEPLRVGQYMDVFFSQSPIARGVRLDSVQLEKKPVDVLKQYAGAVPANAKLNGYQLASNMKSNMPVKWNNLSKITLVRKGQVVDVFASGNGIYVTMKGMALENGVEGGNVTVQNLSSDKKFQAKVLNENSVKVHL